MKTCTFAIAAATALVAAASPTTAQPSHFRRLQPFGNPGRPQNAFPNNAANVNAWPPVGNVEGMWGPVGGPWNNQGGAVNAAEAFPQAGAAPGAMQNQGLEQAAATTTSAPPASQPTVTAAPGAAPAAPAGGEQPPAPQATIMVLLPDFLAPTSSGSGSTMVIAGDDKSSELAPKAPTDTNVDAVKKSAATTALTRTATAAVVLLAVAALGLF